MKCDESLVPMHGSVTSFSVSPAVNTKSFHDAFESMPAPRKVCQSIYEQTGRILSATNNAECEHMAAVNARTGELVADNLGRPPVRGKTGFNAGELERALACPDGVILVHNHPASKPPSYRDVHTAASYSCIVASVIVGHDASVWWVAVRDVGIASKLESHYNDFKDVMGDYAEVKALRMVLNDPKAKKSFDWRCMR
ncbi:hypothetical protein [Arabiibacter massiliensis]|uniref:hypothetical protein n=1 Tax=Arabiibacter massiliensis TaxID=1870985 RepID=UPI0009BB8D96|nr:hypothetical protein [Arabiibacter massiliensis]